jgi:rSAM/selenodomain-associated transferase 1
MMARPGAICVFAKVPRPGYVKTRLARTIGGDRAAALAEAFLEDTVAALSTVRASVVVAFDAEAPAHWRRPGLLLWPQGDGPLGERLERALARALSEYPWAMALGADSPGLPVAYVRQAADALGRSDGPDAVLGPCRDGGFYLLGVRFIAPGALSNVRWSSAFALSDTERALGARTSMRLPEWFDVDEIEDMARLHDLLERGEVTAPATHRLLTRAR